jgi:hypothetical protein
MFLIKLEGLFFVDPTTALVSLYWQRIDYMNEECKIWDPHSCVDDSRLTEYDFILNGKELPTFQNSMMPASSV